MKNKCFELSQENYCKSWRYFRYLFDEERFTYDFVSNLLKNSVEFKEFPILIDIGCGDGSLTSRIAKTTKKKEIILVEPNSMLLSSAIKKLSINENIKVRCNRSIEELVNSKIKHLRANKGLAISIHSSYYFSERELVLIESLRVNGISLLLIENNSDCWVNKIFSDLENTFHPCLDKIRLRTYLNHFRCPVLIIKNKYKLPALKIRPSDARNLIPFFNYLNSSKIKKSLTEKRIIDSLNSIARNESFFSYRGLYFPGAV